MIPENQLQHLTPHQARVQKSLEQINVPAWYKPSHQASRVNSENTGWRRERGGSCRPGWKRDSENLSAQSWSTTPGTSSRDNSRCSTPRPLYSSSYTRWSTNRLNLIVGRESSLTSPSPSHSSYSIKSLNSAPTPCYKQPYLGWRSQDRLNTASCISTPAQRLAKSTIRRKPLSSASLARVTPSDPSRLSKDAHDNTALHDSIKQVTTAIDDYCKTTDHSQQRRGRRQLASKGTFEGLLESSQPRMGRQVWVESSFLPTKPGGRGGEEGEEEIETRYGGHRLEDQMF